MPLPKDSASKRESTLCDMGGARGAFLTRDALSATVKYDVPIEEIQLTAGGFDTRGMASTIYAPICDLYGVRLGAVADTSFSWAGGTCLTEEVRYNPLSDMTDDEFLATLTPGQYAIDYALGKLFFCKNDDTDTLNCSYTTRQESVQVRTLCENQDSWEVNVYTVVTAGTGQQLPSMDVPNGMSLVVRAHPDNGGNIYLAHNKGAVETSTSRLQLGAGQSVTLYLSDADLVWWTASVASQKVEVYVEVSA